MTMNSMNTATLYVSHFNKIMWDEYSTGHQTIILGLYIFVIKRKTHPCYTARLNLLLKKKKWTKTKMSPKESLVNADDGCVVALGARWHDNVGALISLYITHRRIQGNMEYHITKDMSTCISCLMQKYKSTRKLHFRSVLRNLMRGQ